MADEPKFTNLSIEVTTKRKISLLAILRDEKVYELVARLTEAEWKAAKAAGVVKEAMLEPELVTK